MKPIYYETQTGRRTALVMSVGRKWTQLIVMDSAGLTTTAVPNSVELTDITECKDPVGKFKSAAKQFGCTKKVAVALGLKNAIAPPASDKKEKKEDRKTPAKKSPARKTKVTKVQDQFGTVATIKEPKAKKAKTESKPRNQTKAIFIKHWNAYANGAKLATVLGRIERDMDLTEERAKKRWARLTRELGLDTENPKEVK